MKYLNYSSQYNPHKATDVVPQQDQWCQWKCSHLLRDKRNKHQPLNQQSCRTVQREARLGTQVIRIFTTASLKR